MDPETLHKLAQKMVLILTTIWGVFLIPIIIMIILISQGYYSFATDNNFASMILYYNLLAYPVILGVSGYFSWLSLQKKRYRLAIILSFLPLLNILIEFIAIDLAIFLS